MAKRAANNYLTDQNWDDEEEPVEAGTFTTAPVDVIQKRMIKTAKRRIPSDGQSTTSAFKGFSGFTSLAASKPASSAPTFSFNTNATSNTSSITGIKSSNDDITTTTTNTNGTSNSKYMQQLKRLNESVTQWIKDHVDRNAYCILTPIFRDYERYLAELEKTYPEKGEKQKEVTSDTSLTTTATLPSLSATKSGFASSSASSNITPTFMFGSSPAGGASNALKPLGAFSSSTATSTFSGENKKSDAVGVFHSPTLGSSGTSKFAGFGCAALSGIGKSSSASAVPAGGFSFKAETEKAAMQDKAASAPFTFAFSKSGADSDSAASGQSSQAGNGDEEYEPPKVEVTTVKEDDAFYSKRCKLFVQRDSNWKEKGVGNLHLKPCNGKTQLLIRADTSLGNILLNIMLSSNMPMSRQGKNNVTLICVPNPPLDGSSDDNKPVSMLVKVKTGDDADELFQKLQEAKKNS